MGADGAKKYRAIFFDWDGTAVQNRTANAGDVIALMEALLGHGVTLCIISGTTYENIAGGRLHTCFSREANKHLYLGLARGSHNIYFDDRGEPAFLTEPNLPQEEVLKIHDCSYGVHRHLLENYGYPTDIVFGRPNYCKIDILTGVNRAEALYMDGKEIDQVKEALRLSGFTEGIPGLIELARAVGERHGLCVKATCDAKYLEVGPRNKADNVDVLFSHVIKPRGITAQECCFWGDEFLALEPGIWGSDAFMITPSVAGADYFDVSDVPGRRPEQVRPIGGSVPAFLDFLRRQIALWEGGQSHE